MNPMNVGQNARRRIFGRRQCTATNRFGQRCGRSAALAQFTCDRHGAKSPLAQEGARRRVALLLEPSLALIYAALESSPPFHPVAVRTALSIVARYHPLMDDDDPGADDGSAA